MNSRAFLRRLTLAVSAAIGVPHASQAATWTWDGTDGLWSDPLRWTPGTVPQSAFDTSLVFGGADPVFYTSTMDLVSAFQLNSLILNSTSANLLNLSTSTFIPLEFVNHLAVAPKIEQQGSGSFHIAAPLQATNGLQFTGVGTGTVSLSGTISGSGGLTFHSGKWQVQNIGNSFTGGVNINTGAFVEVIPFGGGGVNLAPGATGYLGGNAGNTLTLNGGTLKVTTVGVGSNLTLGVFPVTFGANGGTLDLRNFSGSPGVQGGNIASGDLAVTLNNTAPAVVQFNGGEIGLNAANGNWGSGGNALRFSSFTGNGPLRIEITNGASLRAGNGAAAAITVPTTIRGTVGGDPTSGPAGTVNTGLNTNSGRLVLDNINEVTYSSLRFEGAVMVGVVGTTRALNGSITVGGTDGGAPAHVSFGGRGTNAELNSTVNPPGTNAAAQNPLWLLRNTNGSLTIQDGGIASFDVRMRGDGNGRNGNGVALDGPAILQAGGTLRFIQSVSNASSAGLDRPLESTNANAADNIIYGDITGQGNTGREAVVVIQLPEPQPGAIGSSTIPPTLTATLTTTAAERPFGGLRFDDSRGTADLIVNGTGFGGLKIVGQARPSNLLGGIVDPVSNATKVNSVLTAARLSRLTGSGGYLTVVPENETWVFPGGGEWSLAQKVGLRVTNHTTGVDVIIGTSFFSHNLVVDSEATVSLGAAPFTYGPGALTPGVGLLQGKGTVAAPAGLTVSASGSVSPGISDLGTLTMDSTTLHGTYLAETTAAASDLLAVMGNLVLGATSQLVLPLTNAYATSDYIIATYTGSLNGTFGGVTGLPADFTVNYGTPGQVRLNYAPVEILKWNGNVSGVWNTTTANWQGGATFTNGKKVIFDDTDSGANRTVSVSGGNVSPGLITVNTATNYTLVSSVGSAITGPSSLIKDGIGLLTLTGPADFTGGINVNAGILRVGANESLPDLGKVLVAAGATLDLNAKVETLAELEVSGTVTSGALSAPLVVLHGPASFAASLTTPSLTLNGAPNYTGALTLTGTLHKTGAPLVFHQPIDLGGGDRIFNVAPDAAPELTLAGQLTAGALTKSGNGTLVLTNGTNAQISTSVSGGTLRLGHATAFPPNTILGVSGGTFDVNGHSLTVSGLRGTGGGTLSLGSSPLTVNQPTIETFGAAITGAASVTKLGAGTLTLSGASTFTGGLQVNEGKVVIAGAAGGGGGIITVNPGGKLQSNTGVASRVDMNGGIVSALGNPNPSFTNELWALPATTSTILLNDPDNPGTLSNINVSGVLRGSGTINVGISFQNNPDGGVGFRLVNGTAQSDFSGTINIAQMVKFETISSTPGPQSAAGTGKLVFTGGNFTGGLQGNYSQYNLRNNNTAAPGHTILGNDVEIVGTGFVNINLAGGAPTGAISTLGNLRIGDGQMLGANKNGTPIGQIVEFTSVTLTGGNATFAPTTIGYGSTGGGQADIRLGPITEIAPSGIVIEGTTTVTLAGTNTYTGATRLQAGIARTAAAGALPATTALTVNGGTLEMSDMFGTSYAQTVASLEGAGGVISNAAFDGLRDFTVNQSANTSFAGVITGNLSLVKQGAGSLQLLGAHSFTGTVTVAGGTLDLGSTFVNGSVLAPVTVQSGAKLAGFGSAGTISVAAGGQIAPGGPIGSLTANALTLENGTQAAFDLNGITAVSEYDQLIISGPVTLNGTIDLSLSLGFDPADFVDSFVLISNLGGAPIGGTGKFSYLGNVLDDGEAFTVAGVFTQIFVIDYNAGVGGDDVVLAAIPEPSATLALLGGLGALAGFGRVRRRPLLT